MLKNPKSIKKIFTEKADLHPRNLHRGRYDFIALVASCPQLKQFVFVNAWGDESIDFANAAAVKTLNRALLKHYYSISNWDIPAGYLCPPIPGRADYMHYMADLLAVDGVIPSGNSVKILDIGMGANCVYPLIGNSVYGWHFTGTDTDETVLGSARKIVSNNPQLKDAFECRKQTNQQSIFNGIIQSGEHFYLSICNPPFHASIAEAMLGSNRKNQNLGYKKTQKPVLNFGGQAAELWTKGGEAGFIANMIAESKLFEKQVSWFSTLVSKKENLLSIYYQLQKVNAAEVKTINMAQGQKVSRVVAWRF